MRSARDDVASAGKMATAARFQMWKQTSQVGTYRIDEVRNRQVFEMTCTTVKTCKRNETRAGAGSIAPPSGNKSAPGASMIEVDSDGKDLAVMLPLPLALLGYTQTVITSIPEDDSGGTSKQVSSPWMLPATKAMTVAIPGDLKTVSGSKSFKIDGAAG